MLPRILILALCCTLVSCKDLISKYKRSNTGLSALDRKVLYDFRAPHARTGPGPLCPAPVSPHCSALLDSASGALTYAAESELACLYRCSATNSLEVFSGNKLQVAVDTPFSAIAGTYDLNHDDKNEMLLVGETTHNGEISREASLDTIEKNTLRAVDDLGIVYHDSCSLFAGADEARRQKLINSGLTPYVEAVVVFYIPHSGLEMPNFTAERYRAACPVTPNTPPSAWQVVSR